MQNDHFQIGLLDERACQIVSLMIKKHVTLWFFFFIYLFIISSSF